MVRQLRIVVLTYLLLVILMKDIRPVLPCNYTLQAVADSIKETECKPCSMIQELVEWLNRIQEDISKIEATLPEPDCKFDFEDGIDGWERTGTAFNNQPTYGDNPTARDREQPANQQGDWWIGTAENRPSPQDQAGALQYGGGDGPIGSLTSPFFNIRGSIISFLIGGGCDINVARAELIIDGQVVMTATGREPCTETMTRETWDVGAFIGQRAQVRLVDASDEGWAHINFDDLKGNITCPQN